ncbi:MAG: hypothetical protein K2X11_05700, partial [Acetobacteraceae bacterium]|nr:hypothetical protein [Acetobacteraceae bacterium]
MRRRHLLLGSLSCPGSAGFAAQGAAPFELLVPDDPPYAVPAVGGGPVPALVEAMFRLLGHRLRMVFVPAGIPEDPLWPSGALVAPLRPGVAPRRLTPMIELLAVPRAFATLFHGAPRGLAEAARLGPTGVRAGSACE